MASLIESRNILVANFNSFFFLQQLASYRQFSFRVRLAACAKDACLYQDRAAAVLFKMSCGELSPFLRKTLAATAGDFN